MCRHEGNVSKTTGCTKVIMETVLDTDWPASITLCLYKIHFRHIFKSSVSHTHTHTRTHLTEQMCLYFNQSSCPHRLCNSSGFCAPKRIFTPHVSFARVNSSDCVLGLKALAKSWETYVHFNTVPQCILCSHRRSTGADATPPCVDTLLALFRGRKCVNEVCVLLICKAKSAKKETIYCISCKCLLFLHWKSSESASNDPSIINHYLDCQ